MVVDVVIDQGACFETCRPTSHADPTCVVDGAIHCCVSNMPGNVARTASLALSDATRPHALALADQGWQRAMRKDPHLRPGLQVAQGQVTCEAVARQLDLP